MPLLKGRGLRQVQRSRLRRPVAVLAQGSKLLIGARRQMLQLRLLFLQGRHCGLPGVDQGLLLRPVRSQALELALADADPLVHPGHFRLELLQQVARSHGLRFGLAFGAFQAVHQGREVPDLVPQGEDQTLLMAQCRFEFRGEPQDVAQLALHRKRALPTLFSARHGHVMETLAALGEKEGVWILQRQVPGKSGIGHDVTVP